MPNQYTNQPKRPVIVPIGPSIAYITLTQGMFALIWSSDAERAGMFNWYAKRDSSSGSYYAKRRIPAPGRANWPTQSLQDFILGHVDGYTVDHEIVGNGLDCRQNNLRHAERWQQSVNQRKRRNTTSGLRGVTYHARAGKWMANIRVNGQRIYLGLFGTKEEAYAAYCAAAELYHGKFRRIA